MTSKVAKMLVKLHFRIFFFMFARGARERDFTKVGRVKPGWHGNGKRVSFLTRFVRNFAGVSAVEREKTYNDNNDYNDYND